ncbi:ABC transporter substrate-binding protein [Microbacterium sp. ABRD28]|uniref:ABC transporter substrate-binding protein n=1 Tax=Microbacterium sp. ABRD28 TaxID=2268461 RepID=UPI000F54F94E|nr:ABC transporter substrate-binding protein [Microbacterium sp. ABRD28]AZC14966.1 carbohydrate ABC transporter substrate-binding protein [Microbacterium sp. ABRD28]
MLDRRLMAASGVAVIALAVSGCAGTAESTDAGEEVTSLTLWHGACVTPEVEGLYEAFEAESGITLELVDIPCDGFENATTTRWATGDRPDILTYHAIPSLVYPLNPAENFQDLSDMDFVSKAFATVTIDDTVYGAITQFPEVYGFYYNKAVLADNGLEPPASMADLVEMCASLQGTGIDPIIESGASGWPTQLIPLLSMAEANQDGAYAEAVLSKEETLDDPDGPLVAGLTLYSDLKAGGCFNADATTTSFEDSLAAVIDGEAAVTVLHSNFYDSLVTYIGGDRDLLDETVGFVGLSLSEQMATANYGPFGTFYAPKTGDAAKEAAARQFIEFVTGAGYQDMVDSGPLFPVYEGATTPEGFSELQLSFQKAAETASPGVNAGIPGFVVLKDVTTKILADQSNPTDGAKELALSVQQAAGAAGIDGW